MLIKKKPLVALDLDGVICDTPIAIQNELHKRKYNVTFDTYHPTIIGVDNSRDLLNEAIDHIFTNKMNEIKPCDEYMINILKEINIVADIVIITARKKEYKELTEQWLNNNFPNINFSVVYRKSKEKTAYIKGKGCLCFVEDRLRTANEAAEAGIKTYLINYEWNVGRKTHKDITRISDLSTFHSLLPSKHIFKQYTPKEKTNNDLLGC
jgi:uncharacterized HAD superfamily protein